MGTETQAGGDTEWKAPYLAYSTLVNFIDKKCGANPIPPQIDKTFIDNVAGGVQPLLLAALKVIGFVNEELVVQPLLREAASTPERRKRIMRDWAVAYYAEQVALAEQNATSQMLYDTFAKAGYTGSTLRKAVVFYLAMVEDLGLPKSPHFKAPKQSGPSGGKARSKATPGKGDTGDDEVDIPPAPRGEQTRIDLGDLGSVTVTVDVQWLKLPDNVFVGLRKAIRDLEDLSSSVVDDDDENDLDEEDDP